MDSGDKEFVLRVLTFNVWGLPFPYPIGSKDKNTRIAVIGKYLADAPYDVVALQEVWCEADFEILRSLVSNALPYSFYFYSGLIGSGVCVFSRSPITQTLIHRYSLNGYVHHIHRGDYFGGKVVGLARVLHNGVTLNIYTSHLHAEYDRANDLYLPHRVVQAFELSEFVKATSAAGDVSLVLGDLNLEPTDLGLKLILANGKLMDSWTERQIKDVPDGSRLDGHTCDVPTNSYSSESSLANCPEGKRIDYILYNCNPGMSIYPVECYTAMGGRVPGSEFSYSDHEAVFACFKVQKCVIDDHWFDDRPALSEENTALLNESLSVVQRGLQKTTVDRWFYGFLFLVLLVVFWITVDGELHYPQLALFFMLGRFSLTLVLGFVGWYGGILLTCEKKALKAALSGIVVLLNRNATN